MNNGTVIDARRCFLCRKPHFAYDRATTNGQNKAAARRRGDNPAPFVYCTFRSHLSFGRVKNDATYKNTFERHPRIIALKVRADKSNGVHWIFHECYRLCDSIPWGKTLFIHLVVRALGSSFPIISRRAQPTFNKALGQKSFLP
jgi:hypothetical protein